jgi:hypothetical protein
MQVWEETKKKEKRKREKEKTYQDTFPEEVCRKIDVYAFLGQPA